MDLKAFASGEMGEILSGKGGFAGIAARNFPKPLIAAVNGAALAGGFEIVLACDLVVAADHAFFGIPEVKRGLAAAGGGLIRLAKRIPPAIALELALTGESIDAERALAYGLVNRVVPAERWSSTRRSTLAEVICANAPLAVRASKELMKRSARSRRGRGVGAERRAHGSGLGEQRRPRRGRRLRREAPPGLDGRP